MTWHQWHAAYPTDSSTGTPRRRACSNASSHQGHQSTGLSACCGRYGLVELASRLAMCPACQPRPDRRDSALRTSNGKLATSEWGPSVCLGVLVLRGLLAGRRQWLSGLLGSLERLG